VPSNWSIGSPPLHWVLRLQPGPGRASALMPPQRTARPFPARARTRWGSAPCGAAQGARCHTIPPDAIANLYKDQIHTKVKTYPVFMCVQFAETIRVVAITHCHTFQTLSLPIGPPVGTTPGHPPCVSNPTPRCRTRTPCLPPTGLGPRPLGRGLLRPPLPARRTRSSIGCFGSVRLPDFRIRRGMQGEFRGSTPVKSHFIESHILLPHICDM